MVGANKNQLLILSNVENLHFKPFSFMKMGSWCINLQIQKFFFCKEKFKNIHLPWKGTDLALQMIAHSLEWAEYKDVFILKKFEDSDKLLQSFAT